MIELFLFLVARKGWHCDEPKVRNSGIAARSATARAGRIKI